jgi:hypothetical protein
MSTLPDPSTKDVQMWLKLISREHLHNAGWIAANKRFHGLSRAIRPYINEHFETEQQEAAFDGFTLALLTLARFEDVEKIAGTLTLPAKDEIQALPPKLPEPGN